MSHDDGEKKGLQYSVETPPSPPPRHAIMRYFHYEHLPPHLQKISRPFCLLAVEMARKLPPGPETSTMLRKLLEAKDCAVRANVGPDDHPGPREAEP